MRPRPITSRSTDAETPSRSLPTSAPHSWPIWIDGRLCGNAEPVLPASDSVFLEGRGCYTTARICAGRARYAERHARRLRRDAARIGLGELDPQRVLSCLAEVGPAAFGQGDGIVRVQATGAAGGRLSLVGVPRALGPEASEWHAVTAEGTHPGPGPWSGVKLAAQAYVTLAREQVRASGADEALLFDREGFLVEGSRSNLFAVRSDGALVYADPALGGVSGVGQELALEGVSEAKPAAIHREELDGLRALVAVNSVRGACTVSSLDGEAVGGEGAALLAARLELALRDD